MLQRAASNAYSWWWASHIRTKQSKWLEGNLQDMEEKVTNMLEIIENDGDTFARRVEMYFKKRPELIGHVEDSYRSYRALAERYDHLSKEMQSANRTIAAVFPEQIKYTMDEDDDFADDKPVPSISPENRPNLLPKGNIPRVPSMPSKEFRTKSMIWSKKDHLTRTASVVKEATPTSGLARLTRIASVVKATPPSSLTREEAIEEIEKIQKEILALQTEREFVQSICDRCNTKCSNIEGQITRMQERVMSLRDEFGIGNVIDDDEARTLMAATALKSCKETLVKLQEKQEQSAGDVKAENMRVKEMIRKFNSLQGETDNSLQGEKDLEVLSDEQDAEMEDIDCVDTEALRENIKKKLEADSNSTLTVMQLAERIDELVDTIARLETAVSSQDALINVLRSETDGLQEHIKTLEEEKESLVQNSENIGNKLKELEEELCRVKSINQNVKDQNNTLQTNFTHASCRIDHLSAKLKNAKPHEEVVNISQKQETKDLPNARPEMQEEEEKKDIVRPENEKELLDTDTHLDDQQKVSGSEEEEEKQNFTRLFNSGLEDREKLLVQEYTSVLRNYKDVRRRLGDVEKKNRDGFFELALQIRELKNALALRDEEIQSLREATSSQKNEDENTDTNSTKSKHSTRDASPESVRLAVSIPDTNHSTLSSPHTSVYDSANENQTESRGRTVGFSADVNMSSDKKETRNETKTKEDDDTSRVVSAIEEKFRSDIDGLLEENLEFWLRFSSSFHQIQKFQTSVQDLKEELAKLNNNNKKQEGSIKNQNEGQSQNQSWVSEARPIYRHLKEIITELTLWLETNSVLKDELQGRYAALCSIQQEITRISTETSNGRETGLNEYQAAKFQGEVMNMKQENNKVGDELQAGVDRVSTLKDEVENTLLKLDEEFELSTPKHRSKSRIPLRSFLFGVKLKKRGHRSTPSIFSCGTPSFDFDNDMLPTED